MNIIDDYKPYHCPCGCGLIQDKPGNISGNGIRYTAEYVLALIKDNMSLEPVLTCEELDRVGNDMAEYTEYNTATQQWYLPRHRDKYLRVTKLGEPTSIDDYVAAVFIDDWCETGFSGELLRNGPRQNCIFSPFTEPKYFLGRFPQLFCIANWVNGTKPSPMQELFWMLSVFQGALHKGQDEKVLSFFLIEIGKGRRWVFKPLVFFWKKQLKKHYGEGGLGEVLKRYYNNPNHPSVKWLWGVGVK